MCRLSPDSTLSVSAKNEKLSHIPGVRIPADLGSSLHENQACQLFIDLYKKWMTAGFAPIKWKTSVAKPAIRPYLDIAELTEIVRVQLKQIGQDRLLFRSRWNYGDIVESICWALFHIPGGRPGPWF
jgi:hypothetical protein